MVWFYLMGATYIRREKPVWGGGRESGGNSLSPQSFVVLHQLPATWCTNLPRIVVTIFFNYASIKTKRKVCEGPHPGGLLQGRHRLCE